MQSMAVKISEVSPESGSVKAFQKREWRIFGKERGFIYDKKGYTLAAYEGRKLVGFANLDLGGGAAYLQNLLVSKTAREKGIGKLLLEKSEAFAKKKGCHIVYLKTSEKHTEAMRLYKKQGYRMAGKLRNLMFHFTWYFFVKDLE
jgi:GNAT superfamily N-acetyltransferase